jgi:hypothetical protein
MAKRIVNYPHRIGYRLDDEAWAKLERAVAGTGLSPHDWCRLAALEKLDYGDGLSKSERFLFEQFARAQYLVTQGFQLLAEDKLTSEEWLKFRAIANEKGSEIAERALVMQAKRNGASRK